MINTAITVNNNKEGEEGVYVCVCVGGGGGVHDENSNGQLHCD